MDQFSKAILSWLNYVELWESLKIWIFALLNFLKDRETKARIIGAEATMVSFEFYIGCQFGERLLSQTNYLSQTLQSSDLPAMDAISLAKTKWNKKMHWWPYCWDKKRNHQRSGKFPWLFYFRKTSPKDYKRYFSENTLGKLSFCHFNHQKDIWSAWPSNVCWCLAMTKILSKRWIVI